MSEREIATLETRLADTKPFDYDYHNRVGDVNGVYSFWLNGCCLYVGESANIGQRLRQHRTQQVNIRLAEYMLAFSDRIEVSYVEIKGATKAERDVFEEALIKRMNPKTNTQHAD